MTTAILHVCTTCRGTSPAGAPDSSRPDSSRPDSSRPDSPEFDAPRPGARLLEALSRITPEGVEIRPVECLSACSQGCSVALSGPGRWSYVYGRLTPADAIEIAAGARAYAATSDGIVPWRDRPAIFRKQSLARIPPLTLTQDRP